MLFDGRLYLEANPFEGFGKYDDKAGCRRKRRASTELELSRLLMVAADRPLKIARLIRKGPKKSKLMAKVQPAGLEAEADRKGPAESY